MNERQTTIWNELNTDPENINYRSVRYDNYPALAALLNNAVPGSTVMIPNPEPQGTITVPVAPTLIGVASALSSAPTEWKTLRTLQYDAAIEAAIDADLAVWQAFGVENPMELITPLDLWVMNKRNTEGGEFRVVDIVSRLIDDKAYELLPALATILGVTGTLSAETLGTISAILGQTQEIPDPMWEPEIVDEENSTDPIPAPITRLGIGRVSTVELQSLLNSPEVSWP